MEVSDDINLVCLGDTNIIVLEDGVDDRSTPQVVARPPQAGKQEH
jgi:hypothetical protein